MVWYIVVAFLLGGVVGIELMSWRMRKLRADRNQAEATTPDDFYAEPLPRVPYVPKSDAAIENYDNTPQL